MSRSKARITRQCKTDAWQLPGVTGCNLLAFDPTVEVKPDTLLADEPVGLGVNMKVPQSENPQLRRDAAVARRGRDVAGGHVDQPGDRRW